MNGYEFTSSFVDSEGLQYVLTSPVAVAQLINKCFALLSTVALAWHGIGHEQSGAGDCLLDD